MAKKYYWLKLQNDFFIQKTIKKLRKIAGGDTYTIIYLKMQLLSLRDSGRLYYDEVEDTFANELALALDEEAENIQITLFFLEKHGLLEKISNDEYVLPETVQNIGNESDSAARVRKHRANALQCNALVTNGNIEKKTTKGKEKQKQQQHINAADDVPSNSILGDREHDDEPKKFDNGEYEKLVDTLTNTYGVTPQIAKRWVDENPIEYIKEKISVMNHNLSNGKQIPNMAGFLSEAISKDYRMSRSSMKSVEPTKVNEKAVEYQKLVEAQNEALEAELVNNNNELSPDFQAILSKLTGKMAM